MKKNIVLLLAFVCVFGLVFFHNPKMVLNRNESIASISSYDATQYEETASTEASSNSQSPTTQTEEESTNVSDDITISPVAQITESKDGDTLVTNDFVEQETVETLSTEKSTEPETVDSHLTEQSIEPEVVEVSPIGKPIEESSTDTVSSMELKKVGNLQYYLYTPSNPTADMPLIIYLHGGTNKKEDVSALLTTDGFPKYLYEGYYGDLRAYVAIPKLDNRYKGWSDISDQIKDLVKSLNTNYGIAMNKVSLTGHSMGGTGTYQLQVKLSNTFACVAPVSGSIQNNEVTIAALRKTKIWAFVGTEDTVVSPDSTRTIIKSLEKIGADAKITELKGASHFDVPSQAYKNDALIQWLVRCGE